MTRAVLRNAAIFVSAAMRVSLDLALFCGDSDLGDWVRDLDRHHLAVKNIGSTRLVVADADLVVGPGAIGVRLLRVAIGG